MGNWICAWHSRDIPSGSGSDADISYSISSDNGSTWIDVGFLNTNATVDNYSDYHPRLATDNVGNWISVWYSSADIEGAGNLDFDIIYTKFTVHPAVPSLSLFNPFIATVLVLLIAAIGLIRLQT